MANGDVAGQGLTGLGALPEPAAFARTGDAAPHPHETGGQRDHRSGDGAGGDPVHGRRRKTRGVGTPCLRRFLPLHQLDADLQPVAESAAQLSAGAAGGDRQARPDPRR